jgi:hypothetical protein
MLERINKELKRRSRGMGAFSNDQSLLRVAVCIMMDINEDWITAKRYFSLEEWLDLDARPTTNYSSSGTLPISLLGQ